MYKVTTEFTGVTGSPWYSILWFSQLGGLASDALSATNTFWQAVDATQSSSVRWTTDSTVELVSPASGQITGLATGTSATATGALADSILPPATQALIRWRTGTFTAGREVRGRTFIPGLTEVGATDGNLATSTRTAIANAATALIADANTILVTYSRKNGTAVPVATADVWTQFAVLRSRRD